MRAVLRRILGRPAAPARSAEAGDVELTALSDADRRIIERALPYTMTGVRAAAGAGRRRALLRAPRDLPGAFAECGVWRGGSVLAMILTLQELGVDDRDIYLYDTFEGMTEPTEHDTSPVDPPALEAWSDGASRASAPWTRAVRARGVQRGAACARRCSAPATRRSGCTSSAGPVEETLPGHGARRARAAAPRHRLVRVDPPRARAPLPAAGRRRRADHRRLRPLGGRAARGRRVLRDAQAAPLLLNRIDYTGRIAVKH